MTEFSYRKDLEGFRTAIDWVKEYRARVGCSLREAKDAFDANHCMPKKMERLSAQIDRVLLHEEVDEMIKKLIHVTSQHHELAVEGSTMYWTLKAMIVSHISADKQG